VTARYIAFHAAERPDAIAIVNNGRGITYPELSRDIRKFTRALRAFGLPRGSKAVIDCDDAYFNWLLRLAFEELGVVTAALKLAGKPETLSFLRDSDLVLSEKSPPPEIARRHHATTPQWLRTIVEGTEPDEDSLPRKEPDDPIRIVLTSGTTGTPKRLLYTRRIHEASIGKTMWYAGFTRASRYLLALPLTVAGPTACIRAGGTVVIESRMALGQAIATHGITHTTLPPFALKRVLDDLPAGFSKPADLTILSFGAGISRSLRETVLARLATDLCDMYGSNEAGFVSSTRGIAEIGSVWPGVRVEVVDERDQPLPFGEKGRIRVRTDYMLDGYLDYPQAQGRIFKDGWFYAGDLGILHDAQRLQVIGRADDLLNIGWNKISPETLEELVSGAIEADDLGICSVPSIDGIEEVFVVVSNARGSDQELLQGISRAFRGLQFGTFHIVKMKRIPRTANGKIHRKRLKEAVVGSLRTLRPDGRL